MGLRTPESLARPASGRPTPAAKFATGAGGQIRPDFLTTVGRGVARAEKRKLRLEKDKANFVRVAFENDLDTLRIQSEAKLANSKGVDALADAPDIKKEFLNQMNDRLNQVPVQYRRSLDIQTSALQGSGKFDRFAIGYTSGESRKVADTAYQTRIANEMNDIVDHAANVDYVTNAGMLQLQSTIRENAQRTYGDDPNLVLPSGITAGEMIQTEVDAGTSDAIRKTIQQQVNVNAFDKAQETLGRNFERINPEDRVKIMKLINKGLKDREDTSALSISEEAWTISGGDLVVAENYILAKTKDNGSLFKKATSLLESKFAIRQKQEKQENEDRYNDLYDTYTQTGNLDQAAYKRLPPDDRVKLVTTLNKNKGGEAVITDQEALTQINTQLDRMTNEDIVKIDVNKQYKSVLSADDRELIIRRQNYARKMIETKYDHGQKWSPGVYNEVTRDFAPQLGIMEGSEEYSQLKFLVQDRYAQILSENPKITEQEIRRRLIRDVRDKTMQTEDRSYFFGLFGDKEALKDLPETIRPDRSVNIDSSWVKKIQSARIQAGKRPYTEDELQAYAEYLQSSNRGIDLAKPVE